VDALVAAAMIEALSPSAIEVSLQVAEDLDLERQQLHGQWKQRLERASYETALARRRYENVDPTNRLVARTLERDWDAAMAAEQKLGDDHHRALLREPERLTEEEKGAVQRLADDIPALWQATSTTASDRQAVARLMLDRVVILVRGSTEHVDITCHWAGDVITRHALIRPVRRFEQLEQFDRLIARIVDMRRENATAQDIADRLNAEGWRPPKKSVFDAPMIRRLLQRRGLGAQRPLWSGNVPRAHDDELTIQELAQHLGAHRQTIYGWLRRGTLKGRLVNVGTQRIWLVSRAVASTRTSNRESS
jgi:excisionase family DNA binding protein